MDEEILWHQTAFEILQTIPAANTHINSVDRTISIYFSDEVASPISIQLIFKLQVLFRVKSWYLFWQSNHHFTPSSSYQWGETISVTISSALKNTNQISFGGYSFQFRVNAGNYTTTPTAYPEHTIESSIASVYAVATADMDADGDVDVVYGSYSSDVLYWEETTEMRISPGTRLEHLTVLQGATH